MRRSICIATSAAVLHAAFAAVISNVEPRSDQYDQPLNAHQGSLLRGMGDQSDRYFYYGGHFPNCTYQEHCACSGSGAAIWKSIAVYSSPDLADWRLESEMFHDSLEPRVVANPLTQEYVMVVKAPLGTGCPTSASPGSALSVATSSAAAGPFSFRGCLNTSQPLFSDWSVFTDPATGKGYIIYNSKNVAGQFIEELSEDYTFVVPSSQPVHLASELCDGQGCEAPLMFEREGAYYALFGQNCWCCPEGSELFVYMAPHPLGPYSFHGDANADSSGQRIVHGQSTAVVPLSTANGTQYLWLSDRWQSTSMWSTDFQYWGLLDFDEQGVVKPVVWQDQFEIELVTKTSHVEV